MRVLVTGGFGLIGANLVDALLDAKHNVSILDNSSSGSLGNLSARAREGAVSVFSGDVRDSNAVGAALSGAEVAVHLAAVTDAPSSAEGSRLLAENNAQGTVNLLECCVASRVGRVVFASSAAVYGNGRPPSPEGQPIRPISAYGLSKAVGEEYCRGFSHWHGLDVVILRLFNVYGPRRDGRPSGVVAKFASAAASGGTITVNGDGRQTRDFVYVGDVVEAFKAAMAEPAAVGQTFNVGTGTRTSINAVANLLASSGSGATIVHKPAAAAEIRHSGADVRRAKRILGFRAKVGLKDGLALGLGVPAE